MLEKPQIATKILVADDDGAQRLILRMTLEEEGYEVVEAENGTEALNQLVENIDLRIVLTDLDMPTMNGFELIQAVRSKELRYRYIIVLTALEDRQSLLEALALGADDYLTKPVFPDELKLRLKSGIRLLTLESHEDLIFSMAKLSEFRSEETGFHLERTSQFVQLLARDCALNHPHLKLSLSMAEEIAKVSPLHDLGKVAIPDHILHKPERLTTKEFEIMKSHAEIGGKIIKELYDKSGAPYLWIAYNIAMHHHEKWDGTGYPNRLKEAEIPLTARIMALADVYDAITSQRCYKEAISHEVAKSIIIKNQGTHFDPLLVESFLRQETAWLEIKRRFAEC